MARDFSGSSQYLTLANGLSLIASSPMWLSGWFWIDTTSGSQVLFTLGVSGSVNNRRDLIWSGSAVATRSISSTGTTVSATDTSGYNTTGAWFHVIAEWGSTASRATTINGGTRVSNTTSSAIVTAPDQTRMGSSHTGVSNFNGRAAYVALFSGTPAAGDFTDLSGSGVIANALHPSLTTSSANLIAYWDLDGTTSPEPDGIGSNDMVLNGALAQVASPGIILNTPLTSGTASGSSTGTTTASLSCDAATGGTSPYTYQWYRDVTPGFTASGANDVVGATSLTLNDTGLTASTAYYYRVISTDNVAATVLSNEVSLTTSSGATAGRNRVIFVM